MLIMLHHYCTCTKLLIDSKSCTFLFQCLHSCINDICGRKSNTYEDFKSVTDWTSDEYTVVTNGTKQLFIDAVANQLSRNEVDLCFTS